MKHPIDSLVLISALIFGPQIFLQDKPANQKLPKDCSAAVSAAADAQKSLDQAQGNKEALKSAGKTLKKAKNELTKCENEAAIARPLKVNISSSPESVKNALVTYMNSDKECKVLSGCRSWIITGDTPYSMTFERPADQTIVSGIGYGLTIAGGARIIDPKLILQFTFIANGDHTELSVVPRATAHTLTQQYSSEPNQLDWPKANTLALLDRVKLAAEGSEHAGVSVQAPQTPR